jgi:uncharacterized protein
VEAERIAERLARAIRYRLSRRRKHRPERPVKLVVLLDASDSMEVYSRYFINFVRGLIGRWLHADAFLFHTRLVHIADALRERHPDRDRAQDPSTTVMQRRHPTGAPL